MSLPDSSATSNRSMKIVLETGGAKKKKGLNSEWISERVQYERDSRAGGRLEVGSVEVAMSLRAAL